jgi:hypothetical protein
MTDIFRDLSELEVCAVLDNETEAVLLTILASEPAVLVVLLAIA